MNIVFAINLNSYCLPLTQLLLRLVSCDLSRGLCLQGHVPMVVAMPTATRCPLPCCAGGAGVVGGKFLSLVSRAAELRTRFGARHVMGA